MFVNGESVGKRLWAPYEFSFTSPIVTGKNKLEIMVRNNMANLLKGDKKPFGLRRMPQLTYYSANSQLTVEE